MQKRDNRFYTFFLSHKTKTKNYIRRIEISKNIFHSSLVALILSIVIISLGFFKNNAFAKFIPDSPIEKTAVVVPAQAIQSSPKAEYKSINYDRPAASQKFIYGNSETVTSLKPFPIESEAEKNQMEFQLRVAETTSSPAFLPSMWAHLGKINNEFGFRRNPFGGGAYEFHAGLDIGGETGDAVAVTANGVVTDAGWKGGYGNMIEVDHGNGLKTRYGHLSRIGVQIGEAVQRTQIIGLIGSTGRSTGPHLHYEVRFNERPINPRRFLPPAMPEVRALIGN
jgi:murein DD-endopeptidase MepM/ murein hydrolase activator NlpD